MRALGVIALVLCVAGCGGSHRADRSTMTTLEMHGPKGGQVRAYVLHHAETKLFIIGSRPRRLAVVCISHGVQNATTLPLSMSTASHVALGRDVIASGPSGSAVISFTIRGRSVTAHCR